MKNLFHDHVRAIIDMANENIREDTKVCVFAPTTMYDW